MRFDALKSLAESGPLTLSVAGDCMSRVLPRGSEIQIASRQFYLPGDILTFRRGAGGVVTHRALGYLPGRGGWRLLTRADGASTYDAPLPLRNVLGRVVRVDGKTYRPRLRERLRAVAAWPVAAWAWLEERHAG